MNKAIGLMMLAILAIAVVPMVSATLYSVKVHAVDQDDNNLQGVLVAPEWKLGGGWNDFYPKDWNTDSNGIASRTLWKALPGTTVQVNYAELEGYTCTSKEATRKVTGHSTTYLEVVCTQDGYNDVPEFGLVGAGIVILGGAAFLIFRKN
jgi:hypothetical protein